MAKEKCVGTYVSYAKPVGAFEGRMDLCVNEEETKEMAELEQKYDVFTHLTPSYGLDLGCIAVKRILPITRYGDVLPCPYIHLGLGNIFEEPLKQIVDRALNIKWFDPHKKHRCLCGVDHVFINNVLTKTYGIGVKRPVGKPITYDEIFPSNDFIKPNNMGKVKITNDPGTYYPEGGYAPPPIDPRIISGKIKIKKS